MYKYYLVTAIFGNEEYSFMVKCRNYLEINRKDVIKILCEKYKKEIIFSDFNKTVMTELEYNGSTLDKYPLDMAVRLV